MATDAALDKKIALTVPNTMIVADRVNLMLSLKCYLETPELDSLWFLCILSGFTDLRDHSRIHADASSIPDR